ncbi:hypothetical protein GALMADRAFT_144297 [Galerina marginata CBS 339.88]|uniref:TEA domain-containing protein n=1 Tax=Galerina marginata (strain CBS 339.88) TaxID=685588 RepID=A0A067SVJ8_GALM3|nr:hypothetical protein GALMADRAFT_144297 [Galerina marginata CBS 339.88]
MLTTVEGLSYTPSEEEIQRDASKWVFTGRKGWKTAKGTAEAIWPPKLEAAFLKALRIYKPEHVITRRGKPDTRFPKRNSMISDYILEHTGVFRTPKQISSRIQQLRSYCKEKERALTHLFSSRHNPDESQVLEILYCRSATEETPSTASRTIDTTHPLRRQEEKNSDSPFDAKYINIMMQNVLWPFPPPTINFEKFVYASSLTIQLTPLPSLPHGPARTKDIQKNPLPFLSNYVQFLSPLPFIPQTVFEVYISGNPSPVHIETSILRSKLSPDPSSQWLYGVDLVPMFWNRLSSSQVKHTFSRTIIVVFTTISIDATQFTILQTLEIANLSSSHRISENWHQVSIIYEFTTDSTTRTSRTAVGQEISDYIYSTSEWQTSKI